MKTQANNGMPTANIAINKSRIKLYDNDTPTYYLKKGQEFQIELFNPTKGNILAKIYLNSKSISQGGLILRPGERVFLDRYIDVANKFKFETYMVDDTDEVKAAIEDNGDFKVEFYRERVITPTLITTIPIPYIDWSYTPYIYYTNTFGGTGGTNDLNGHVTTTNINYNATANYSSDLSGSGSGTNITNASNVEFTTTGGVGLDSLSDFQQSGVSDVLRGSRGIVNNKFDKPNRRRLIKKLKSKKSIETGTVEKGSYSNQKFETVSKDWETFAFQTVQYKLLPLSQKVNTTADISVKRYCTECGSKSKPNFKFCPTCGTRI